MRFTRRRALFLLGLLGTGSIPLKALANKKTGARTDIAQWLAEAGYMDHHIVAMGREYLRITPGEADLKELTLSVCGNCAPDGHDQLRERVRQRVRNDYAAGRVVLVDGWLLAVTEARLYAIASLL